MKKKRTIILLVLAIAVTAGFIYWQFQKKGFVRDKIETAISKGTDSLYYIHYDRSSIDEIAGNASFFDVSLQSDSLQKQLLQYDTASAKTVFNVQIKQVNVRGANIPALISNSKVEAKLIEIIGPVIYIINGGNKKKENTGIDTLELYEKILGKYSTINADEILVSNGQVYFADQTGSITTSLKDISIRLNKFRIDSTRDYANIISYFIKDVVAKVKTVGFHSKDVTYNLTNLEYNAPGKFINLENFTQADKQGKMVNSINQTSITNINTDSFILRQQLKADELKTAGGTLQIYRNSGSGSPDETVAFENESFDKVYLKRISIGNTKIELYNRKKPGEPPLVLTGVRFSATGIERLNARFNVKDLIGRTDWILNVGGFSFLSEDKIYRYQLGNIEANSALSTVNVQQFSMVPQVSEAAFFKAQKVQTDLYNLKFDNISFKGIDIQEMISNNKIRVKEITLQPTIHIFNDRTVAPNPASKVGMYPQQQLVRIKQLLFVKKINIKNGTFAYKERGAESRKTGTVFFKDINGSIVNVTNMPEAISRNNLMQLDARASFMGVSKLFTTWKLPLAVQNGAFAVSGNAGSFDATVLNSIIEPLGLASVKNGRVDKLKFDITGTDLQSKGSVLLLYKDLKLELLKMDSTAMKKKGFMSLVANMLLKNDNPQNGVVRDAEINYQRDTTKSFFNLVWKSIFEGAKKTVQKL